MGGPWVVNEGYLQCRLEGDPAGGPSSPLAARAAAWKLSKSPLVERYVVLTVNRKLEFFDTSDPERRSRVDSAYLAGFCGWDGDGLLKADAYGLELKVDKHRPPHMFMAAFNRLDLEKWCRAFLAVLKPDSEAGQEVKRERRRAKKEEKRLIEEREEKIRKLKEKRAKMIEDERMRLLAREEEISNMTPLERIDDIGSLDDDTARLLEKRKQRLQRRQAPTMGRVNKSAYRRRMEEAAGGKTDNVQPLQTKVVEQKSKVRVELPPPGQFIEATSSLHRHRSASTASGSSSDERSSLSSRLSSGGSSSHKHLSNDRRFSMGGIPPPPPPPPPPSHSFGRLSISSSSSQFIPPPPPYSARSSFDGYNEMGGGDVRLSRSGSSLRSSSFDTVSFERPHEEAPVSRGSQSRRRMSNMDQDQFNVQANLAAILGGRPKANSIARQRHDSFESTASSTTPRRNSKAQNGNSSSPPGHSEPTMANAFAASLAAIRRNRADTVDEDNDRFGKASPTSAPSSRGPKARNRTRDSQLSAEGKSLLKKAIDGEDMSIASKASQNGRKGLFDDSSSDDDDADSDSGLFASNHRKSNPVPVRRVQSFSANTLGRMSSSRQNGNESDSSDDSATTAGGETSLFAHNLVSKKPTSPKSTVSSGNGFISATPPRQDISVTVTLVSSAVQTIGKKADAVFTFAFRLQSVEHVFSFTYGQFEEIHKRLTSAVASTGLPKFPSKHLLRNNIKPENMQKRAQELLQYLQQLVSVTGMVTSPRFQFEFNIDGAFARALVVDPSQASVPVANGGSRTRVSLISASPTSSVGASPAGRRSSKPPPKKHLFGSDDSDSDSDTSSVTPQSIPMQLPPRDPSSKPDRRRQKASQSSSHDFGVAPAPIRRKSRASSRASQISSSRKSVSAAPEPPPKMPAVTGMPAGRPNPFAGGRGDLLAAIRKGTDLRKTGNADVDSGGDASSGPPSVATPPRPPPPAPMTQATSIGEAITNAMAARRIHVEYEETHSDDDSDDDWDD